MEIELNFRLDGDGRTVNTKTEQAGSTTSKEHDASIKLNYQSRTFMTNMAPPGSASRDSTKEEGEASSHQKRMDELLMDCEISDCGLMPRTFWVPSQGMKPRCQLEQMALDIFHSHVPPGYDYDPETSGAEWWAQLRPSPEGTGRYSMHDDKPDELSSSGISFHWDKDEDLRILTGGTTYIHPHLSTVTYLTDIGGPTFALNYRVHNLTGDWISPETSANGFVSWPKVGKHLVFDGRFLHSAPADLMEPGTFEQQIQVPISESKGSVEDSEQQKRQLKRLRRRHRRVTFLVNIWLNYKPFDVKPFPETMIDKMSGVDESTRSHLIMGEDVSRPGNETVSVSINAPDTSKQELGGAENISFRWPMGDCESKEFIDARMPIQLIRKQGSKGGNIQIHWDLSKTDEPDKQGIRLVRESGKSEEVSIHEAEKKRTGSSIPLEQKSNKRSKTETQ